MTKEYKIEVRVKNNLILARIHAMGFTSMKAFTDTFGISYTGVSQVLTFRKSPFNKAGLPIKCIRDLVKSLNCKLDDIFTVSQLKLEIKGKKEFYMEEPEIIAIIDNNSTKNPLELLEHDETFSGVKIQKALETLTERERQVINHRFALGDIDREYTTKECGEIFGVSSNRILQIERKALRKLRHPSRACKLLGDGGDT